MIEQFSTTYLYKQIFVHSLCAELSTRHRMHHDLVLYLHANTEEDDDDNNKSDDYDDSCYDDGDDNDDDNVIDDYKNNEYIYIYACDVIDIL